MAKQNRGNGGTLTTYHRNPLAARAAGEQLNKQAILSQAVPWRTMSYFGCVRVKLFHIQMVHLAASLNRTSTLQQKSIALLQKSAPIHFDHRCQINSKACMFTPASVIV